MRSLFFIGVVLASASFAIIRRADRPDARYLEAGARYPAGDGGEPAVLLVAGQAGGA
jgi:hypothetical protein